MRCRFSCFPVFKQWLLYLLVVVCVQVSGQSHIELGKKDDLEAVFFNKKTTKQKGESSLFELKINNRKSISLVVEPYQTNAFILGTSKEEQASLYLAKDADEFSGHLLLKRENRAFKVVQTGEMVSLEEADINSILCVNYETEASKRNVASKDSLVLGAPPILQSRPGANGVVLLDFDGQVVSGTLWADGATIVASEAAFSASDITAIWRRVSEDYFPFNVDITTDEAVFNAYPRNRRVRCIFTPTTTAGPNTGGIAYLNSFNWNNDTPCWVFIDWAPNAGEAASHEIGHAMGLSHDGNSTENYYNGHSNWAPIMGVSYGKTITQWSKGEYQNANNKEDDVAMIARTVNGIGFVPDDHANTIANATPLVIESNGALLAVENKGLIERQEDKDFFTFTITGGEVEILASPNPYNPNLDIQLSLYNSTGLLINAYNPTGLSASFKESLQAGTYYIAVDGIGFGNPLNQGYTDYGSLGIYTITGQITSSVATQVPYQDFPWPIPGTIEMEDFDLGGQNIAYNDLTAANLGGQYRTNEAVDIQKNTKNDIYVSNIQDGEWMEYTVVLTQSGFFGIEAQVASTVPAAAFHIELNRANVSGTILVGLGGTTESFKSVKGLMEAPQGEYTLRFVVEKGGFTIDKLIFTRVTVDCNREVNGSAVLDKCGFCSGGNTGVNPCTNDFEAENACRPYQAEFQREFTGYSGTGYLNPLNFVGSKFEWSVVSPSAKSVQVVFRYGNQRPVSRDMDLYVNGLLQTRVGFPSTGTWSNWTFVKYTIQLEEGINVIKMSSVLEEGGPLIDYMSFTDNTIQAHSCNLPIDCHGDLNGKAYLDRCDSCAGGATNVVACVEDCHGDPNGKAFVDNCKLCAGGNTGIEPNTSCIDCNQVTGGSAYTDSCGVCVGGNTGRGPCVLDFEETYYHIIPSHSDLCVQTGNPLTQQLCDENLSKVWYMAKQGFLYSFLNKADGSYFGDAGNFRGADLLSKTSFSAYRIEQGSSVSTYRIVLSQNMTFNADVSGGSYQPGGKLILWTRNAQDNQQFVFEKVPVDCHGDVYGEALIDACGTCAGGNTGLVPVTDFTKCLTGVDGSAKHELIVAYPNPTDDKLYLSKVASWKLYSPLGELISVGESSELTLSDLPCGLYLLQTDNQLVKVIKE